MEHDNEIMEFTLTLEPDEDGFTGRECPECEKYFKVKYGTGLPDSTDFHCPYCNHVASADEFFTKDQIEYINSVALREVSGMLLNGLKSVERKPDPNALFSIGISVKGDPTPLAYYTEKELEERVVCEKCTLEYTIYGIFGWCPDCGIHNSLQMLKNNFNVIKKTLDIAMKADGDVRSMLVNNALEDVVSAFDAFGRSLMEVSSGKVSFQNIQAARDRIEKTVGVNIASGLDEGQWKHVCAQFQKRHLLAHKMGVMDEEYVKKAGCNPELVGRKVDISPNDVESLISCLTVVADTLFSAS